MASSALPDPPSPIRTRLQGWGLASLALGCLLILASAATHILAWLYVSLSRSHMSDLDSRLGLAICTVDSLLVLLLGVLGIVAGALGLREARNSGGGGGLALVGLLTSCAGLITWLLAAANLVAVAVARLA